MISFIRQLIKTQGSNLTFTLSLTTLSTLFLVSCEDSQEYPPIPEIEYVSHQVMPDESKLRVTISYLDGDGDLGLRDQDNTGDFSPDSKYYHNLFFEYYEEESGFFRQMFTDTFMAQKGDSSNLVKYNYRFPYITPDGDNKAIKGELTVDIPIYGSIPVSPKHEYWDYSGRIKFNIYLVDRALNHSNVIESPAINLEAR